MLGNEPVQQDPQQKIKELEAQIQKLRDENAAKDLELQQQRRPSSMFNNNNNFDNNEQLQEGNTIEDEHLHQALYPIQQVPPTVFDPRFYTYFYNTGVSKCVILLKLLTH